MDTSRVANCITQLTHHCTQVEHQTERPNSLKLILSLAFWPTRQEEVVEARSQWGYDRTMKRVLDNQGKSQYEIKVYKETYITESVVLDWKARDAVGRATRVWQARELNDPSGQKSVLKEVWLEENTCPDSIIWDKMSEAVSKSPNDAPPPHVRDDKTPLDLIYVVQPTTNDNYNLYEVETPIVGSTILRHGSRKFAARRRHRIVWKGPPLIPQKSSANAQDPP
ncbi:hypothetical protein CPB83DRAFT_848950 [Crepidotus variabilis]|uniref:Uncharacterized protein n=1 Tax=Crepidotus variabilis TaxID=179855 RepID=A0A9P6JSJ0_9AGAR|nr:hypothetical protein CPB83DRAFT_848950 [Crepidotus variabilis]